jgi:hypothetical protein
MKRLKERIHVQVFDSRGISMSAGLGFETVALAQIRWSHFRISLKPKELTE